MSTARDRKRRIHALLSRWETIRFANSEKECAEDFAAMIVDLEDRLAATPAPLAQHPGENHDYRMTCLRCGEPGYLFVGFHSPGETFNWSEAQPKEAE
jgi:hypothetical protein